MRVPKQYEGISSLTVLRNTRVVTLTFGGSECYDYRMTGDIPEGFTRQTPFYPFSFVLECNPVFTVVKSGCNHHVFITADIRFNPPEGK